MFTNENVANLELDSELRVKMIKVDAKLTKIYLENKSSIDSCVQKVLSWDFSRLKDYMVKRENYIESDADLIIKEYAKFLALGFLSEDPMPISQEVDPAWHAHILFTRDYREMCENVFGKFIDHNPTIDEDERIKLKSHYITTLAAYNVIFGQPDKKFWPSFSQVCENCFKGCDCTAV